MVKIQVSNNIISITGHAGYAEQGKDIVCAGVSALTCTLAMSLDELTRDEVTTEAENGKYLISLNGNLSRRATLLIDSFLIGVSALAEEYPEHISLSVEGVKSYGKL